MVQKHRCAHKATIAKDVSPMRNMAINKYALSSSPKDTLGFMTGSRLSVPLAASAAPADKWKYNNMINQQRDQFNSMHFC